MKQGEFLREKTSRNEVQFSARDRSFRCGLPFILVLFASYFLTFPSTFRACFRFFLIIFILIPVLIPFLHIVPYIGSFLSFYPSLCSFGGAPSLFLEPQSTIELSNA